LSGLSVDHLISSCPGSCPKVTIGDKSAVGGGSIDSYSCVACIRSEDTVDWSRSEFPNEIRQIGSHWIEKAVNSSERWSHCDTREFSSCEGRCV